MLKAYSCTVNLKLALGQQKNFLELGKLRLRVKTHSATHDLKMSRFELPVHDKRDDFNLLG